MRFLIQKILNRESVIQKYQTMKVFIQKISNYENFIQQNSMDSKSQCIIGAMANSLKLNVQDNKFATA